MSYYDLEIPDEDVAGWKLYYEDGTVYTNLDGTWDEAPDTGVQILIVYGKSLFQYGKYRKGRNWRWIRRGKDYYVRTDTGWSVTNLAPQMPSGRAKEGTEIERDAFRAILNTAFADFLLPGQVPVDVPAPPIGGGE